MTRIKRVSPIWNSSDRLTISDAQVCPIQSATNSEATVPYSFQLIQQKRSTICETPSWNRQFQTGKTCLLRNSFHKKTNFKGYWIERKLYKSMQNKNKSRFEIWKNTKMYSILNRKVTNTTLRVWLHEW